MTFKDISFQIFKGNLRRYLAYFLSSSFSIAIFFIYSTIVFHKDFSQAIEDTFMSSIMSSAMMIVGIFAIFFISYAHTSFIRSRNKEFGLFLTLGMTTKDIGKMIRIENGIIGITSLLFGLLTGTIFSRIFFMVVIYILDLEQMEYHLNINSYLSTLAVFVLIFLIVITISRRVVNRLEIVDLLKDNRKGKGKNRSYPMLGFLGIILVVISFSLFYFHLDGKIFPDKNNWMFVFLGFTFVGLYLMISEFGSMMLSFTKRNKSNYYKNLLTVTEINHKYRLNARIIFITSILSAAVIFVIGIVFSLYSESLKVAYDQNPFALAYELDERDDIQTRLEIEEAIQHANSKVTEEKVIEYIDGVMSKNYNGKEIFVRTPAISSRVYEELTGERLELNENEVSTLVLTAKPEKYPYYSRSELVYKSGKEQTTFNFKGEINRIPMNLLGNFTYFLVIINDADYIKIRNNIESKFVNEVHMLNFENWRAITGLSKEIKRIQGKNQANLRFKPQAVSRIDFFLEMKQGYGFTLFIMSFIGLLFFITAGNVLYFKLRNDIEDTKSKYEILAKIGIRNKEMKQIISKELKLIFFVPFGIGIIVAYAFIWVLMVNISIRSLILLDTSVVVLVYFIFQSIFYMASSRKYYKEILSV